MIKMMDLSAQLNVLARAVFYKNLSAASIHVGLSQPQLSRIIQRLEEDLGLRLLDRTARRKSAWTPEAHRLAELHSQSQRRLEHSIQLLKEDSRTTVIRMGTLEGIAETAVLCAHEIFEKTQVSQLHLDVLDFNELDAKFLSGGLDLILTTHYPSKAKPKFAKRMGYQSLDWTRSNSKFKVQSSFEFGRSKKSQKKQATKTLISNSLLTRKLWLEKFGGEGQIPSDLRSKPSDGLEEVLLLANDALDPNIWTTIKAH